MLISTHVQIAELLLQQASPSKPAESSTLPSGPLVSSATVAWEIDLSPNVFEPLSSMLACPRLAWSSEITLKPMSRLRKLLRFGIKAIKEKIE